MNILTEQFGLIPGWFIGSLFVFLRYALFAGLAYGIFYLWKKSSFRHRKIQSKQAAKKIIREEILHSALTAFIFALAGIGIAALRSLGLSKVYTDISAYGIGYLFISFIVLIILHDTYFYWMHRLMHQPRFFKIFHLVHHKSNNPTPWASLAFHPLEAIAEIAIVPILVLFIPFHPIVLLAFASWSLLWNVVGHLGYELFPKGWVDHPVFKWFNTSTHHNLHHHYSKGNYGLYFNWWDHWMGTNHPTYKQTFRRLTQADTRVSPQ